MAKGRTARHEAKRTANEDRRQERGVAQRLSKVEAAVKGMTKTLPPRPEDVVARQAMKGEKPDFLRVTRGNASYDDTVRDHISRIKGRSTSGVVSDKDRGA